MTYMKTMGACLAAAALVAAGCDQKGSDPTGANKAPAGKHDKDHGHGPNGGVVFDLGKYHAEFTVDHPAKSCTVLVLGADEKTPTAVAATELTLTTKETKTKEGTVVPPMTVKLLPQGAQGGKASKFVGTDPGLGNAADFAGTIISEIDGKPSQGEFKE